MYRRAQLKSSLPPVSKAEAPSPPPEPVDTDSEDDNPVDQSGPLMKKKVTTYYYSKN